MSSLLDAIDIVVVDSVLGLRTLLENLETVTRKPSAIFIDLQGVQLGRHGSVSILSLYIDTTKTAYLIDVHCLGSAAFQTTQSSQKTLKTILESPLDSKVVFDSRNDCDALFNLFGVQIAAVQDLQLMELASRRGKKSVPPGLDECVRKDVASSDAHKLSWQETERIGVALSDPKHGGRPEVFNDRPLSPEIARYCATHAIVLARLHTAYSNRLSSPGEKFWRQKVEQSTSDRLKLARDPNYDAQAASRKDSSWDEESIQEEIDAWNDDILMEALNGGKDELEDSYPDEDDDWYQDTARDCIGWEDDMIARGSPF